MWIKWRKFTNGHWLFGRAPMLWMLCAGGLLTAVLLNFAVFEGQAGQTKQRAEEKPKGEQISLKLPEIAEERAAPGETPVADFQKIRAASRPVAREIGYVSVKVNLKRQMLTVVNSQGQILKTLPISSGNGKLFTSEGRTRRAITPRGSFTVYRKIAGWRRGPLGPMYYPNYIVGGIAIHGSPSVPSRPASHGCIRIPMYAAKQFSDMTPIGTPVLVF